MMRSSRPSTATAARKSHARAFHARASKLVRVWNARACDLQAVAAAHGRLGRTIVKRFANAAQRCARIGFPA
eukprot:1005156-Lingulodinium_polyedra.AAC.1